MSDPEFKSRFFKLADLSFTWVVLDKDGIKHFFKSEKEAIKFMMDHNIPLPKGRRC